MAEGAKGARAVALLLKAAVLAQASRAALAVVDEQHVQVVFEVAWDAPVQVLKNKQASGRAVKACDFLHGLLPSREEMVAE